MLLNYLYKNFYEQSIFETVADIDHKAFNQLKEYKIIPGPSYVLDTSIATSSFFGNFKNKETYSFYIKGLVEWLKAVRCFDLKSELRAKSYFSHVYGNALKIFFSGEIGQWIELELPNFQSEFNEKKLEATWQYFLDGTYGVCTRTSSPEDISLKQCLSMFIERFCEKNQPGDLLVKQRSMLAKTIDLLDTVESDFAPHEIKLSSRQRCIIDTRKKYFSST